QAALIHPPESKSRTFGCGFFMTARRDRRRQDCRLRAGRAHAPSLFQREQLCQQGIALCQVLFDFTIALSTVSSFRMQAVMATLGCLPAARSRSWNARISGLQRIALIVAM